MEPRQKLFFERITAWIGSVPSFIVHTLIFIGSFGAAFLGYIDFSTMLLVLTTVVSLEAIYLSIFIQMTVNRQTENIQEVSEDVEDLQENIEGISEDVEEIHENVEDIQEDVSEMSEDWDLENGEPIRPQPPQTRTLEVLTEEVRGILTKLEALQRK